MQCMQMKTAFSNLDVVINKPCVAIQGRVDT